LKLTKILNTLASEPKYNRKIVETDVKLIPLTHIHDQSLFGLGTDTSIKSGGIKLVLLG